MSEWGKYKLSDIAIIIAGYGQAVGIVRTVTHPRIGNQKTVGKYRI